MADRVNRKTYQRGLPKKRISAGCLFFDEAGRLLIVNPTYKDGWEIPGGVVEANESPRAGCAREVREELGLDRPPVALLCVDFTPETADRTESLNFIFYGGVLSAEEIAAIRLPEKELSEFRLLEPEAALALLKRRLRRRLRRCLPQITAGSPVYLEDQDSPWPVDPPDVR